LSNAIKSEMFTLVISNFKFCHLMHTKQKSISKKKGWSKVGFKPGTLWFTALMQNHRAKQALTKVAIH